MKIKSLFLLWLETTNYSVACPVVMLASLRDPSHDESNHICLVSIEWTSQRMFNQTKRTFVVVGISLVCSKARVASNTTITVTIKFWNAANQEGYILQFHVGDAPPSCRHLYFNSYLGSWCLRHNINKNQMVSVHLH